MIPILFEKGTVDFTTQGIGRLVDCVSCTVTEERNGIYECQFTYPVNGRRFADIAEGRIIYCTHDDTRRPQPFDIYGRSAPLNGVVTFYAHHVSYRLSDIVVRPFTAEGIAQALAAIPQNTYNPCPFTFVTDKTDTGEFVVEHPVSARQVLSGMTNDILNSFGGGEFEYDGFTVYVRSRRGTDTGVEIRYGKNLTDLTDDIDTSECYDAVVPYWFDDSTGTTVAGSVVARDGVAVANAAVRPLDLSSSFTETPTAQQLEDAARAHLAATQPWVPSENIRVSFAQTWQTEDYRDLAQLQRVGLGDAVRVIYATLGVDASERVIKTTYNALLERYDEMELGQPQETFARIIRDRTTTEILEVVPTYDEMDDYVEGQIDVVEGYVDEQIVDAKGYTESYVTTQMNPSIPDTLMYDYDQALNQEKVFNRLTENGTKDAIIRDSQTGNLYINAEYIRTKTLSTNLVLTGAISNSAATTYWSLDDAEFVNNSGGKKLKIANGQVEFYDGDTYIGSIQYDDGAVEIPNAKIGSGISVNDIGTYIYGDLYIAEDDTSLPVLGETDDIEIGTTVLNFIHGILVGYTQGTVYNDYIDVVTSMSVDDGEISYDTARILVSNGVITDVLEGGTSSNGDINVVTAIRQNGSDVEWDNASISVSRGMVTQVTDEGSGGGSTEDDSFTITPPSSATVTAGQNASFTASVTFADPNNAIDSVTWEYWSGVSWDNISTSGLSYAVSSPTTTSSRLTIRNTTTAISGSRFRVQIVSTMGSTNTSADATLTVQQATSLSGPNDTTVNIGDTAAFTVYISGADIDSSEWYYYARGGTVYPVGNLPDALISETTGYTTLYVDNVTAAMDGYTFYATITTTDGRTLTSAEATLTVDGGQFAIITQPQDDTISAGGTAVFTVDAVNYSSLVWVFGPWGLRIENSSGMFDLSSDRKTLRIVGPSTTYNGYEVSVEFRDLNNVIHGSDTARLYVN